MNSNSNLPALSSIPQFPDMVSSSLRSIGEGNQRTWIVVFDYPDCVREFDGRKWSIVLDKRTSRRVIPIESNPYYQYGENLGVASWNESD